jgi:NADH:ubiquinone oxidoreductase subunit 2 (subunit N)
MMYMTSAPSMRAIPRVPRVAGVALVVSALIVFYLGILPTQVLNWAAASIGSIF